MNDIQVEVLRLVKEIEEHESEVMYYKNRAKGAFGESAKEGHLETARTHEEALNRKTNLIHILRG